jgi:hypothetical protein
MLETASGQNFFFLQPVSQHQQSAAAVQGQSRVLGLRRVEPENLLARVPALGQESGKDGQAAVHGSFEILRSESAWHGWSSGHQQAKFLPLRCFFAAKIHSGRRLINASNFSTASAALCSGPTPYGFPHSLGLETTTVFEGFRHPPLRES